MPPETIQPLKGKPETGINTAVIHPQLTIRSPYAAPFEFFILPRVGSGPRHDIGLAITHSKGNRKPGLMLRLYSPANYPVSLCCPL